MFEQALRHESRHRQGWSFAGSLALEVAAVTFLLLMPVLNTYEIDLGAWARSTFRLAIPAPPAPPPRAAPAPQPGPVRFQAEFRVPSAIPDRVAILHDKGLPLAPIGGSAAPMGMEGGTGEADVAGVLGMMSLVTDKPPLPPPIRVGGRVQSARLLHQELPVYPPEAVEQHLAGTVKLEAIIGVDGLIRDLRLIEGHPMLAGAAMDAVARWRYRPTRLNGEVVEVITLIDVNFNLTVLDEKELKRRRRQAAREARKQ